MLEKIRTKIFRSATELERLRPLWEEAARSGAPSCTIFQNFDLNLLAARVFADREAPCVVCAETSYGMAILPSVIQGGTETPVTQGGTGTLRLLGEELFDYRRFLRQGDPEVLGEALASLAGHGLPLEITAMRACDVPDATLLAAPGATTSSATSRSATSRSERPGAASRLPLLPFCQAPMVNCRDIGAAEFAGAHSRLARNLRRLVRLGFRVRCHRGDYPGLLRWIYERKAAQTPGSLFNDPARVEFMVQAGMLLPEQIEIFTLEDEASVAAAVVSLREESCRRFYTGCFSPELEKHSPALSLIFEVTRLSLEAGLDCDYMTGEHPYKLRLATGTMPLYRVRATAAELAACGAELANAA